MSALLTYIGHESQILWLRLPRLLWRGVGFPPPTHLISRERQFLLNTHIRTNQQGIDLFGCPVISTNRKLQKHSRKKNMLFYKGNHDPHLKRLRSYQKKKIYGTYVSGKIFRCISSINRVRCFQTTFEVAVEDVKGLTKRKGSTREEWSTWGLTSRLTSHAMPAQRRNRTHTFNWSAQPLPARHRHGHASTPAEKATENNCQGINNSPALPAVAVAWQHLRR